MSEMLGILWFVLDEQSSSRLRQAVPPRHPNHFYHHVTLAYGVKRQDVASFIDRQWTITVYAEAYNGQTQACRVETNGLPDTYGAPHITLSTAEGIKPFASVAMLHGDHNELPIERLELTGIVEFILIKDVRD